MTGFFGCLIILTGCQGSGNHEKGTSQRENVGQTFDYSQQVTFMSAGQKPVAEVRVAIADTPEKRDAGLMNVRHLPEDAGMLFIFDKSQPLSFWMANTPLPLDIIFIDRNHKIVRIYHSTTPFSKAELKSGSPAQYVVEVNGGYCIDHDITEGMSVKFSGK